MEAGAYVWCSDDGDDAWILAEVLKKKTQEIELQQVDKTKNKFTRPIAVPEEETTEIKFKGVELANTKLSDEERAEGRDNDIITLPHLHEPALLHAISERFFYGKIYTWTGPVLIAVNPFQRLPLYTEEILNSYRSEGLFRSQGMGDAQSDLDPHVFAVADRSYRQMMSEQRKSQSILISGESGAGKTESTKIVMSYLTTIGGMGMDQGKEEGELSVMERVLQSNPVLEAFGNARTLRNDNSSRFGKFIELGFSRPGHLLGAKVQTYLLEKVRIAFHGSGERNYHIFYQLLRGASDEQKQKYHLHEGETGGVELSNHFHYTKQGGAPSLREFTDEAGFAYTLKAMTALGWSDDTIDKVLGLIAGILHLGETDFGSKESSSGQDAADVKDREKLERTASLLGVDADAMAVALTEKVVVARGEEIRTELTPDRAVDARDALAKTIYGALFLWVVDQVNHSICWEKNDEVRSSVGVLDIFGFECFDVNSFEQLCINFTNEALQQQFNMFIFKLEQAEYEAEQIEWAFIAFPDNQDCLDAIQQKKIGILSMLDDECRLPKGSDRNWAKRMYEQNLPGKDQVVSKSTRFSATKMQQANAIFCVRHFAGIVEYTAETSFMEKNKDEIPLAAHNLFQQAPTELIRDVYAVQLKESEDRTVAVAATNNKRGPAGPAKSKTVGQQFKEQLTSLITSVEKTDPHYIRCLKPNDAAKPKMLTRKRLTEQLRYGGVLEAVRVARAGYPVRLTHQSFFQRYRMLLPAVPDEKIPWSMEGREPQQLCVSLLVACLEEGKKHTETAADGQLDPGEPGITRFEKIRRMQNQPIPMVFPQTDVQLGLKKVFMRKPPHDALEAHRVFHQRAAVTMIQCWVRGLERRKKYYIIIDAVNDIQRFYRGKKGREKWTLLRGAKAGLLLTNHFHMQINRRKYVRAKKGVIRQQALFRGFAKRRVLASIKVQTFVRLYRRLTNYRKLKSALLALQCRVRVRIAQQGLKGLMGEQKNIGKLKENNDKLKMEMQSLKAMLAAQAKEDATSLSHNKILDSKQAEITRLEKRVSELEKQLAAEKSVIEKLEGDMRVQSQQTQRLLEPGSPRTHNKKSSSAADTDMSHLAMPSLSSNYVSPEVVAQHKSNITKLEDELKAERKHRRQADGEIIKLRAAINGVELGAEDVDALLATKLETSPKKGEKSSETPVHEEQKSGLASLTEGIASAFKGGEEKKEEKRPRFSLVTADLLPRIRRGLAGEEEKKDVVLSGWKAVVRSRKEREEILRDEVHRFEAQMKGFVHTLEEGVDVVMWQMNKGESKDSLSEFPLTASHVTIKMQRKGDLMVQSALNFILRGGYLSKAIGRNRNVNKSALEPLSLHDILEVKAGCSGFDHTELPSAAGRAKSSKGKTKSENRQGSLFVTLTATPTPLAASRSYILRFKSRSARNDLINGLRSVLADMQIHEGVSVSGLHSSEESPDYDEEDDVMVPLGAVHKVLNREREAYDRIILMLLQGTEDLKEKEDELLKMRSKLESVVDESAEKDRVQANDSKLIMQLSKKLETLLMDNEDLRDQNDRLNTRLIAAECEKMNMMS
jgi:myosin-5